MNSHPVTFTSALALHKQEKRKLDNEGDDNDRPTKKSKIDNEYSPLISVCNGDKSTKYNMYGIVLKYTAITPTKGKDHMCMAFIADESLTSFQIRFFGTHEALPQFRAVGDVIRLHRVMIDSFGSTYGLSLLPNFSSVALFDGSDKPCDGQPLWLSQNTSTDQKDSERVEALKKWFKEHRDVATSFNNPTPLDEDTIKAIRSNNNSPVKHSTHNNNNSNTNQTSPTKNKVTAPLNINHAKTANNSNETTTAAVSGIKDGNNNNVMRAEVMNTVFLVKNNMTNTNTENGNTDPLSRIKKELPHYVPLGQLDPQSKTMVDLICRVELVAQEVNLKKVWIWDGTANPPGSMLLIVWNKSLPNFGNPTEKWVALTRVKIKSYKSVIDMATTDKSTIRVLEDTSPLIGAALKANNVSYVHVPKAKNNDASSVPNAAQQSLTVISAPDNGVTPLTFVANDTDVGKYRVEGTVVGYWPRDVTKFSVPVCSQCRAKMNPADKPMANSEWKCSHCSSPIQYTYRCAIKIKDETDELTVAIVDEGADLFFKSIPATDLTISNVSLKSLESTIKGLVGLKIELCVMTYFPQSSGSKSKKCSQVFGTELKSFLFNKED